MKASAAQRVRWSNANKKNAGEEFTEARSKHRCTKPTNAVCFEATVPGTVIVKFPSLEHGARARESVSAGVAGRQCPGKDRTAPEK